MGLKNLLTDLQASTDGKTTIPGFMPQRSPTAPDLETFEKVTPHVIVFKNQSIGWPDGEHNTYSENQPFVRSTPPDWPFKHNTFVGDINSDAVEYTRGGGSLGSLRRAQDWERIGNFFKTTRGKGFLEQQMLLQLTNPRVDAPMVGLFGNLGGFAFLGGVPDPNQQTYNYGINTQIQSVLSGISHIPREGLIPFVHSGYADGVKRSNWDNEKSMANKESNRMVHLFKHKIADSDPTYGIGNYFDNEGAGGLQLGGFGNLLNKLTGKGEELFSYLGGPDSLFGLGRTFHGRYTKSTVNNYEDYLPDNVLIGYIHQGEDWNLDADEVDISSIIEHYDKLQDEDGEFYVKKPGVQNYLITQGRLYNPSYDGKTGAQNTKGGFDYHKGEIKDDASRTYHRESRIGLGTPGRILTEHEKYTGFVGEGRPPLYDDKGNINYRIFVEDKIDRINALDIVRTPHSDFAIPEARDLVRFRFEAIDNNKISKGASSVDALVFRAFIDDISDNFTAEHNSFEYNGRPEKFYTYKSFERKVALSFKIAAQSRWEMMPLYRKLNFLVSNTAPDYSPSTGRMRTPFMRLSVGDWMHRLPGVINNVNLKWQKDYPWEINLTGPEDDVMEKDMLVLPHVLDVSLAFTPIHNFLPRKSISEAPFILPNYHGTDGSYHPLQKWLSLGPMNQKVEGTGDDAKLVLDDLFGQTNDRFHGGRLGTGLTPGGD